ncbi:glycerophosphoryl diester phosphodiesterase [Fluviispira vulneris]|uniref:glycerophosphoryl diester phosphodiesterase n=1 Tax=Fluviispira vulneris TaxID=2763012 RepID=UPI001647E043|nr:glycerophosphoryl diester phosphodiesterase [Fluviispira vulneris]
MQSNLNIPRIIGHRGAKGYAPENTLSSFRKAKELGTSWVEFDVKETEDGVLVIMHDDDLDRTTNGKGPMAKTPWKQVKELDAGAWFNETFKGEKIPTFEETILLLKELNLGANIEIKPCINRDERTATAVANTILNKWPKELPPPLVSSFSMEALKFAKRTHPELIIGALFETLPADWEKIAKEVQAQTINIDQDIITLELITKINNKGYPVLAYTVNEKQRAYDLFNLGVHSIFTDYPWKD